MRLLHFLEQIRTLDVADIAVVALILYFVLVFLRRNRAGLTLLGFAILGAFYVAARSFGLQLTTWIFQGFFAILVLILVVIFQGELRRLFEAIAVIGLGRRRRAVLASDPATALTTSVFLLAQRRWGALIVIPGDDPIGRHLSGDIALGGLVSDALLQSLFDPHSPGHDGAIVIEGDRVSRFGAHLPLSTDLPQLVGRGTRHSAALGLAERTDALCIIVSEERGTVSIARDGTLREIADAASMAREIAAFRADKDHEPTRGAFARTLRENSLEKVLAVSLALALWLGLVPGSQVLERTYDVAIVVENLPSGYELRSLDPPWVKVAVTGPRRAFLLVDPKRLSATVDGTLVRLGQRTVELSENSVNLPKGLSVAGIDPGRVRLLVDRSPTPR